MGSMARQINTREKRQCVINHRKADVDLEFLCRQFLPGFLVFLWGFSQ
jgi:hypothetical protein